MFFVRVWVIVADQAKEQKITCVNNMFTKRQEKSKDFQPL